MFFYHFQLAWRSIKRNPILCGLMILSLASGVTATMVCYTAQHSLTKNPLAYKDDRMFLLQLNNWPAAQTYRNMPKNHMPDMVTYRDATTLLQSKIPSHQTITTRWGGVVTTNNIQKTPSLSTVRISTRDYFEMFDEEFLYGAAWDKSADFNFEPLVVINELTNQHFFNGKNSVGESITLESKTYKVVGVIKQKPTISNRMQNVIDRYRVPGEDIYLPFSILIKLSIIPWHYTQCPLHPNQTEAVDLKNGDCLWLSFWVDFSNDTQKKSYEDFIQTEFQHQFSQNRDPISHGFALSNTSQLLELKGIASSTYSVLMKFGFAFLLICSLNCIAILLAKYFASASESGLRLALGASRISIFVQHIIESLLIGILGGLLSLVTTTVFLTFLKNVFSARQALFQEGLGDLFVADSHVLFLTLFLALTASLFAGCYPAWIICRTPAAHFLKTN